MLIFILSKDWLLCLWVMIIWFEVDGLMYIYVVDIGSIYLLMFDYLVLLSYEMIFCKFEDYYVLKFVFWDKDVVKQVGYEFELFVYIDCDIVFDEVCLFDWLQYFFKLLWKYEKFVKVGFGLKLVDILDCYVYKKVVFVYEYVFWKIGLEDYVFVFEFDIMFVLYWLGILYIYWVIRMGGKYFVWYLFWYYDFKNFLEEEKYYFEYLYFKVSFWICCDRKLD